MTRKKPFAANAYTANWLRKMGWSVGKTEQHNTFSHKKHDLFGVIDMIALKAGRPKLAVQATAGGNAAARVAKVLASPEAKVWVEDGALFWVICWEKKNGRWEPDIRDITLGLFGDDPAGHSQSQPVRAGKSVPAVVDGEQRSPKRPPHRRGKTGRSVGAVD